MDFSRLSTGAKIALVAGVVLLVDSFLAWYSAEGFGIKITANAWDVGLLAWGGCLAGFAAGVILALKAMGKKDVATSGMSAEKIAMILGIASFVMILLRLVTDTEFVAYGTFIGVVASAAVAYGAWVANKETAPASTGMAPPPAV